MGIEPFDCSATQTLNESYILDVVVEDSLGPYRLPPPHPLPRPLSSGRTDPLRPGATPTATLHHHVA